MSAVSDPLAAAEWRANWRVVVAGIAGMMLGSLHAYSIGVMISPLEQEFGWRRAEITSGILITSIFSVLLSPFMGMAIDRFGPRRIGLIGAGCYCAALALVSVASHSIWSWWILWSILALALLQIKPTVWVAAISSLFDKMRGLALAIILSAIGVSQTLTPYITYQLVENVGWRMAYMILGAGSAALALPFIYFWFTSAHDKMRGSRGPSSRSASADLPGMSLRNGLRTPTFYRLALGAITMSIASAALTINLVPILSSIGISRATAASIAGIAGLSAIAGRLSGGYLLDRFNARLVGGISVLLPIISCAILLALPGSTPTTVVAVIIIGLAAGAEMDAIAYLTGRCFGLRNFGALFGTLTGIMTLGIGIGPNLANAIYDSTHSYEPFLWAVMPLSLLASWLFFTVGPYPDFRIEDVQDTLPPDPA